MTHNHDKAAADGTVHISPRYLAASRPTQHQAHIATFGTARDWLCRTGAFTLTATSVCGRVTVHHDQRAEGLGPHLVITARTGPRAPERWRADIAGNTPVEVLATLTTTIADRLEADPDHLIYGIGPDPDLIAPKVDAHRWDHIEDHGLAGFQSRDGHAFMIGRPDDSPAPPLLGDESLVWHIGASTAEHGGLWAISFTYQTPPVVVNSVLSHTLSPEPVTRPATETVPAALAPLVTVRATQPHPGHRHSPPLDGPPHHPGAPRRH
ncbi:DUF317 domain-containing protein [Streptomyces sp. NPDC051662]|uniref:DUF317 domain-containing protein n=1 Tax=Streptomyces sp. NPDC051662 TaxID=3154750 RepID=UPI003412A4C6